MKLPVLCVFATLFLLACKVPGSISGTDIPHKAYANKLKAAGLENTALGMQWFGAAGQSFLRPVSIGLPYKETGYFNAGTPRAVAFLFACQCGERLTVTLTQKPVAGFIIFSELYRQGETDKPLVVRDTAQPVFTYEIAATGNYLLRLQPELLKGGEYTCTITRGPSLAFPVQGGKASSIGSYWGASRDVGARSHEGVDIFGRFRAPVTAAADGVIGRVANGGIGGKTIFLYPDGKNYSLYYAHLDSQLVQSGQAVKTGDVIGWMGNTGNARTTPTHLHFGIYASGGAVNPLPFIRAEEEEPRPVAATGLLDQEVRMVKAGFGRSSPEGKNDRSFQAGTFGYAVAASAGFYRILLPDSTEVFIQAGNLAGLGHPLSRKNITRQTPLLESVYPDAPAVSMLQPGTTAAVLAGYNGWEYVQAGEVKGWMRKL